MKSKAKKSWRDEAVERLDAMCGLNPTALEWMGTVPIQPNPWWRNRAIHQPQNDSPTNASPSKP